MDLPFKEYIIWVQTDTNIREDIFLIDGQSATNEAIQQAFRYILPSSRTVKWLPIDRMVGSKNVSSLKVYCNRGGDILISSYFEERDNKGRKVVYLFCVRKAYKTNAASTLKEISASIGHTPNESDLLEIQNICESSQETNKKLVFCVALFVIILILIIIFTTTCQRN